MEGKRNEYKAKGTFHFSPMKTRPRALITDDNPANLYLLESVLKGYDYDVTTARNGREALEVAKKEVPDIIIADILMPVMDGFALCREWKADPALNRVPFIFYTATYTDPRDEKFAVSLGAERFVIKPQKPEVLARIVQEVLDESRGKEPAVPAPTCDEEKETLQQYNEVLFRKLGKKVRQLEDEIAERRQAEEKMRLATIKLALLSEIAYQDIQNKVTALRGLAEMSRNAAGEPDRQALTDRSVEILDGIYTLINKTKDYQHMGVDKPRWIPLEEAIRLQFALVSGKNGVMLACELHGMEIFADPLIERVFFNLVHNAVHHGRPLTQVTFSCTETAEGALLVCEDDGAGIDREEKNRLFERVVGGPGKFGLFFAKEFLTLCGMSICEAGEPGRGARFEIRIPKGLYRCRAPEAG